MRSSAALAVVLGAALALRCGGESSSDDSGAGGSHLAGRAGSGGTAGTAGTAGALGGRGGVSGSAGAAAQAGTSAGGRGGGAGFAGEDAAGSAPVAGRAGGSSGGAGGASAGSAGDATAGAGGEQPDEAGLAISKVAIYQAVEIPLMADGEELPPNENSPLIAERDALLRVWLSPGSSFVPRSIGAELTIVSGLGTRTARLTHSVLAESSSENLASTLNFDVRADEVGPATTVSLNVHELADPLQPLSRWPESGERALEALSSRGPFLVTLVPMIAGGHSPDLGPTNLARYERYLSRLFPASSVDMTVRAAVTVATEIDPDGSGWDEALDQLYALRDADDPEPNVYYYGVLTPGATFDAYCQDDCVVGLSTVASRGQVAYRGAIGTGYFESSQDTFSQETMAHELGHALGRDHSPCGTDDGEQFFPYDDGHIGVFGYDGSRVLNPEDWVDVMGYCVPVWISDYTYDMVFDRITYANASAPRRAPAARSAREKHRTVRVGMDGRLGWGRETAPDSAPEGEATSVELLDAGGRVVRTVPGSFARFDHLPGGFVSVPAQALSEPGVTQVRIGGRTLDLR